MSTRVLQQFKWDFLRSVLWIAVPIALQSMLFSSRSLIDIMMLGQLGNIEVAAVGIAGKAFFIVIIMLFGVTTGGSLLAAQYWGAKNHQGVRQATALTLAMSNFVALCAASLFYFIPESIMALATDSVPVIALGAEYLQITALTPVTSACVISMAVGLRSIRQPGLSTVFSTIGISLNIFLNWVLIFGKFGFPAMGVEGAAWATLISGVVEAVLLYGYLYARKHLLAFDVQTLIEVCNKKQIIGFLKLSIPLTINGLAWSGGIFVYHAIIGQLGVDGLAAMSVITPVESLSLTILIGVSTASSVVIGNQLGANNSEEAYYQAWALSIINFGCGIVMAIVLLLIKDSALAQFTGLSAEATALTEKFFIILAVILILRSIPMVMINGVLKAGGDIKFCFYQDFIAQWCIGIPVTAFCAFVLKWPIEWVFALLGLEEFVKWFGSLYRVYSRQWIQNLVA